MYQPTSMSWAIKETKFPETEVRSKFSLTEKPIQHGDFLVL